MNANVTHSSSTNQITNSSFTNQIVPLRLLMIRSKSMAQSLMVVLGVSSLDIRLTQKKHEDEDSQRAKNIEKSEESSEEGTKKTPRHRRKKKF